MKSAYDLYWAELDHDYNFIVGEINGSRHILSVAEGILIKNEGN